MDTRAPAKHMLLPVEVPDVELGETRTERHRREVFERLTEAARKLMFTRALDDATVQEITDLADLGKGTFFNYFRTKEHIVPAILGERTHQIERMIEQVKSGQLSARRGLIDHFTKFVWQAAPGENWLTFYGSILRALTHNDDIRTEVATRNEVYVRHFEALVAVGQERGEFRKDYSAATLSAYINRLLFGLVVVSWIGRVTPGIREEDALMNLIIESIAAPGSTATPAPAASRPAVSTPPRRDAGHATALEDPERELLRRVVEKVGLDSFLAQYPSLKRTPVTDFMAGRIKGKVSKSKQQQIMKAVEAFADSLGLTSASNSVRVWNNSI